MSSKERLQSRSVAWLPLTNNEGNNYIWQLLRCYHTKLLQIDDEAYLPPTLNEFIAAAIPTKSDATCVSYGPIFAQSPTLAAVA